MSEPTSTPPTPEAPNPDETRPQPVAPAPGAEASRPTTSSNPFLADTAKQASPRSQATLPWVLVAVLTVISAVLAGILLAQQGELTALRGKSATAGAPSSPAGQDAAAPGLPKPVTDPATLEAIKKLPHRTDGDPLALGKVDAPVVMVTWSDFRCPFCSKWERETLTALKPYIESGTLRVEHRDLVLFGDDSQRTAVAGRAAGKQGKFWEFASVVAKHAPASGHPAIDDAAVLAYAKEAGVPDIAKFTADTKLPDLDSAVKADTAQAQQIGISGTPFFLINTTPINGAQPTEVFAKVIEANGGKK